VTTAIICTVLLGVLVFGLGLAVSLTRGRTKTLFAYKAAPTDPLHKLVRAHGDATGYAPMLAVLALLVGSGEPATWALWAMGIGTASRYVHALGTLTCRSLDTINPLRFAGALGTYLCGLALCVAALGVKRPV
jgi:hypothetical protein